MKMNKIALAGTAVAAVMMLGSCGIYKKYETPTDTALTQAYVEARQAGQDSTAFGALLWEQVFTDPKLVDLINQALENNANLQNAKLNVDIANANLLGAKLSYLPSVAIAPNGGGASYAGSDLSWSYQLPAQASWEVDIFGKLLNNKRSAKAAVLRSEAYAQATRSQIIASVANTYYAIAAVRSQLELSRNTAVLWKETVQTMKDLKEAGRGVTEAAVVQSAANYYSILASITDLEVSLHEANNSLSLLLNTTPQNWNISPDATLELPEMLRDGIPMRELAARPDVLAAEQSLAMAYYGTNQARAAFYPGLNISATGGFTNSLGSMIVNPANWFASLAGSLAIPLFARGQLISGLEAAKAQQKQALNNFQYTLLSASAEVSDAMMLYSKSNEKSALLVEQVANLEKAVEYTHDLLELDGSSTYLEVLTAQQTLLSAQLAQAACDYTKASSAINLYQSLGGGR